MVRRELCHICRRGKQNCVPKSRIWIDGGRQDKCDRCTTKGLECGPPEWPVIRERARRRRSTPVDNDKQQLSDLLTSMATKLATIKQLRSTVNSFDDNGLIEPPDINANLITSNVLKLGCMITIAEGLADRLLERGNADFAERGYTRILDVYQARSELGNVLWAEMRRLLLKLAKTARVTGEGIRADSFVWEALESHEDKGQAQLEDYDLLKELALSSAETSKHLKIGLDSTPDGAVARNLCSPFPPLQRMILSKYAEITSGSPFHRGPFMEADFSSNQPIVGGLDSILDLIQVIPDADLVERNFDRQSPLHMAVSNGMEGLSWAIMERINKVPSLSLHQAVNSKDRTGRGVLGAAIAACCSIPLIGQLITHGAEVDPELMQQVHTPLQQAVLQRSAQTVELLLQSNAQVDLVFCGSMTPLEIARSWSYQEIVMILEEVREEDVADWPP